MKTKRPWTRAEKSLFLFPLLLAGIAGALMWWQTRKPVVLTIAGSNEIRAVEWSPEGKRLVALADYNRAIVVDVEAPDKILDLRMPPTGKLSRQPLAFGLFSWSPDGKRIAAGYGDNTRNKATFKNGMGYAAPYTGKIAVWNAQNGDLTHNWLFAPPGVQSFASVSFSRDGKRLVSSVGQPTTFDAQSGARLRRFGSSSLREGHFNDAESLLALASGKKQNVEVRDTLTGKTVWQSGVSAANFWLAISWNEQDVLALEAGTQKLLLWDGRARRVLPSPPLKNLYAFELCPNAPRVALKKDAVFGRRGLALSPANLVVWDFQQKRFAWSHKLEVIEKFSWSPDGKWLAVSGYEANQNFVWMFDAEGELHWQHPFDVTAMLSWAPDSHRIALNGKDKIEILRVAG